MTEPDDRAERALRDALGAHANEPHFEPLRLNVAAKPPRRLPRWVPAAAALVLVAVVGIPLMLQSAGSGAPTAGVPADAQAERAPRSTAAGYDLPTATPGWRWESHRVLSYQVPTSWGYGWAPASDWCAGGQQTRYGAIVDVALGDRPVRMILCPRAIPVDQLPMFVSVRAADATDRGWDLPSGWSITSKAMSGYVLDVVHPDREARVADEIVASVRPIGDVDPNGCPATAGSPVRSEVVRPDRVSLCQYDLAKTRQLVASKVLVGDTAQPVFEALTAAPKGVGPDDPSCQAVGRTEVIVRLWKGSTAADVSVRYAGCQGNGVTGLDGVRKLTRAVCQAVMVPPITFTTGHGQAGRLCAPDPKPSASPSR